MSDLRTFEKDGKSYPAEHIVTTTLWLEKFRCSTIAAELLINYMRDETFRKQVDTLFKLCPVPFLFEAKLSVDLDEWFTNRVAALMEWHELGEEEPEEERNSDEL